MSKYYEIVKKLQHENKGKIVLVRNGIFYCAIGKDAVLMVSGQQKDVLKPQT